MKKLLIYITLAALLVPIGAQAQFDEAGFIPTTGTPQQQNQQVTQNSQSLTNTANQNQPALQAQATAAGTQRGDDIGCGLTGSQQIAICITNLVYYPMVGLGSWFAYIAAFFFDYAVILALNSGSYAFSAIFLAWQTVRDVANMAFLFIVLYIGFTIMMRADTSGTIKLLVSLVIAALLVNFSFLITRVVIDTGNILAVQFYNAIGGENAPTIGYTAANSSTLGVSNFTAQASGGQTKDLTASIMNALQIQTLTSNTSFQNYIKSGQSSFMYTLVTLSAIYIAMGIMFFILAGSFLYAGAKFIIRIVGLWIVIFTAPVAFVAAIFKTDKGSLGMAGQGFQIWMKYLLQYSFYPAVYLFMFWVLTLIVGNIASGNIINDIFNNAPSAAQGSFSTIALSIANIGVRLGFIIALMYLALSIADKIGGYANGAAGWFQKTILSGAAGGAITGPARWLANSNLVGKIPKVGGGIQEVAKYGTWADVRNIPLIGGTLRTVTGTTAKLHKDYGSLPVNYGKQGKTEKVALPGWPKRDPGDEPRQSANAIVSTTQPTAAPATPSPASTPSPAPRLTYNPGTPVHTNLAPQLTHNSGRIPVNVSMDNEALEKIKVAIKQGVKKGAGSTTAAPTGDGGSDNSAGVKDDIRNIKEAIHTVRDSATTQAPPRPTINIHENMNFYERLGLKPGASIDEIRSAFRDIAKEIHPDTGSSQANSETMKLASEAYNTLKDDRKRSSYNLDLAKGRVK